MYVTECGSSTTFKWRKVCEGTECALNLGSVCVQRAIRAKQVLIRFAIGHNFAEKKWTQEIVPVLALALQHLLKHLDSDCEDALWRHATTYRASGNLHSNINTQTVKSYRPVVSLAAVRGRS